MYQHNWFKEKKYIFQNEDEGFELEKEDRNEVSVQPNKSRLSPDQESSSEVLEPTSNEGQENNDIGLLKQREFIEKLQRLSSLKRKSDEFLHQNYYSDPPTPDKRTKVSEKPAYIKINQLHQKNSFDNVKNIFEENSVNITKSLNTSISNVNPEQEIKEKICNKPTSDGLELKTECDDTDIIVNDPAVSTTPKSYDSSKDGKKGLSVPMEYQSPQDSEYIYFLLLW